MVSKVSHDKNVREPCCHGYNNKHVGKVREWLWEHKQKCQEEQPSPFIKCINVITETVSRFKVKLREEKRTELKGYKSIEMTYLKH